MGKEFSISNGGAEMAWVAYINHVQPEGIPKFPIEDSKILQNGEYEIPPEVRAKLKFALACIGLRASGIQEGLPAEHHIPIQEDDTQAKAICNDVDMIIKRLQKEHGSEHQAA